MSGLQQGTRQVRSSSNPSNDLKASGKGHRCLGGNWSKRGLNKWGRKEMWVNSSNKTKLVITGYPKIRQASP